MTKKVLLLGPRKPPKSKKYKATTTAPNSPSAKYPASSPSSSTHARSQSSLSTSASATTQAFSALTTALSAYTCSTCPAGQPCTAMTSSHSRPGDPWNPPDPWMFCMPVAFSESTSESGALVVFKKGVYEQGGEGWDRKDGLGWPPPDRGPVTRTEIDATARSPEGGVQDGTVKTKQRIELKEDWKVYLERRKLEEYEDLWPGKVVEYTAYSTLGPDSPAARDSLALVEGRSRARATGTTLDATVKESADGDPTSDQPPILSFEAQRHLFTMDEVIHALASMRATGKPYSDHVPSSVTVSANGTTTTSPKLEALPDYVHTYEPGEAIMIWNLFGAATISVYGTVQPTSDQYQEDADRCERDAGEWKAFRRALVRDIAEREFHPVTGTFGLMLKAYMDRYPGKARVPVSRILEHNLSTLRALRSTLEFGLSMTNKEVEGLQKCIDEYKAGPEDGKEDRPLNDKETANWKMCMNWFSAKLAGVVVPKVRDMGDAEYEQWLMSVADDDEEDGRYKSVKDAARKVKESLDDFTKADAEAKAATEAQVALVGDAAHDRQTSSTSTNSKTKKKKKPKSKGKGKGRDNEVGYPGSPVDDGSPAMAEVILKNAIQHSPLLTPPRKAKAKDTETASDGIPFPYPTSFLTPPASPSNYSEASSHASILSVDSVGGPEIDDDDNGSLEPGGPRDISLGEMFSIKLMEMDPSVPFDPSDFDNPDKVVMSGIAQVIGRAETAPKPDAESPKQKDKSKHKAADLQLPAGLSISSEMALTNLKRLSQLNAKLQKALLENIDGLPVSNRKAFMTEMLETLEEIEAEVSVQATYTASVKLPGSDTNAQSEAKDSRLATLVRASMKEARNLMKALDGGQKPIEQSLLLSAASHRDQKVADDITSKPGIFGFGSPGMDGLPSRFQQRTPVSLGLQEAVNTPAPSAALGLDAETPTKAPLLRPASGSDRVLKRLPAPSASKLEKRSPSPASPGAQRWTRPGGWPEMKPPVKALSPFQASLLSRDQMSKLFLKYFDFYHWQFPIADTAYCDTQGVMQAAVCAVACQSGYLVDGETRIRLESGCHLFCQHFLLMEHIEGPDGHSPPPTSLDQWPKGMVLDLYYVQAILIILKFIGDKILGEGSLLQLQILEKLSKVCRSWELEKSVYSTMSLTCQQHRPKTVIADCLKFTTHMYHVYLQLSKRLVEPPIATTNDFLDFLTVAKLVVVEYPPAWKSEFVIAELELLWESNKATKALVQIEEANEALVKEALSAKDICDPILLGRFTYLQKCNEKTEDILRAHAQAADESMRIALQREMCTSGVRDRKGGKFVKTCKGLQLAQLQMRYYMERALVSALALEVIGTSPRLMLEQSQVTRMRCLHADLCSAFEGCLKVFFDRIVFKEEQRHLSDDWYQNLTSMAAALWSLKSHQMALPQVAYSIQSNDYPHRLITSIAAIKDPGRALVRFLGERLETDLAGMEAEPKARSERLSEGPMMPGYLKPTQETLE